MDISALPKLNSTALPVSKWPLGWSAMTRELLLTDSMGLFVVPVFSIVVCIYL